MFSTLVSVLKKFFFGTLLAYMVVIPSGCNLKDLTSHLPGRGSSQITLNYWGLYKSEAVIQPLIDEYQKNHTNVTINYQEKSYTSLLQYKETLFTRLKEGTGPDIARVHLSWLPRFTSVLAPAPENIISLTDYQQTFYPVASDRLVVKNTIYALPLMYDGLLLYYNTDHFTKAGIALPPTDWESFRETAVKIVKNGVAPAGAAIGTSNNVSYFSDIISLMWAQTQVKVPQDLTSPAAQDAVTFYTQFVSKDEVWKSDYPNSLQAFANGTVSMIFAPASKIDEIKRLNPGLKFKIAAVPQIPALSQRGISSVNWATFWAEGVNANSKNKEAAWEFLKYLSESETMQKIYAEEVRLNDYGEPYSRVDLSNSLLSDPYYAPLIDGAKTAVSHPLADEAGNDSYTKAVGDVIDNALAKKDLVKTLTDLQSTLSKQ